MTKVLSFLFLSLLGLDAQTIGGNYTSGGNVTFGAANTAAAGGADPAYVQMIVTNNAGASRTTIKAAFTNSTTAGNMILVGFYYNSGATLTDLSDTLGNTYTFATKTNAVSTDYWVYIYYATNIASGAGNTITATFNTAFSWSAMCAYEFSGVKKYQPVDQMSAVQIYNGTVDTVTTPSKTTTADKELITGYFMCNAPVVGSGFTTKNAGDDPAWIEYRVQTAQGSVAADITDSPSPGNCSGIMVTFFKAP